MDLHGVRENRIIALVQLKHLTFEIHLSPADVESNWPSVHLAKKPR